VPIGDILLQQKIALEGDEEATLRIAGRSPVPILGPPRDGYRGVYMSPDGPVYVDSNGQPLPDPTHLVGQLVRGSSSAQGNAARNTDPDRASGFGWNVAVPQREEFGWDVTDGSAEA
jgi:hypothetical protein